MEKENTFKSTCLINNYSIDCHLNISKFYFILNVNSITL